MWNKPLNRTRIESLGWDLSIDNNKIGDEQYDIYIDNFLYGSMGDWNITYQPTNKLLYIFNSTEEVIIRPKFYGQCNTKKELKKLMKQLNII